MGAKGLQVTRDPKDTEERRVTMVLLVTEVQEDHLDKGVRKEWMEWTGKTALWGTLGLWGCLVVKETRGQRGSQVLWDRKEMQDLMDFLDKRERWEHLGS